MTWSRTEPRTTVGVASSATATAPVVDVAVPVFNEDAVLASSVERLHRHLSEHLPYPWRITIVDNASTDATWAVATDLASRLPGVAAMHLDRKGRGLALRDAWGHSDAQVVAYVDVDLSTGLDALLPLVAPLVSGHSDVAIGSRLAPGAHVARGPRREVISRTYNAILRTLFAVKVRDAQCGFKAVRRDVAERLLPEIVDDGWFFDTELLLLAEHNGLRVHEVPVDWIDDPDSRVDVTSTALRDLAGCVRMMRRFASGRGDIDLSSVERPDVPDDFGRRVVTFGAIGAVSTLVSLVLFLVLVGSIGSFAANLVALGATFAANTWAHARFTAGRRRVRWGRAIAAWTFGAVVSSAVVVSAEASGAGRIATAALLVGSWLATSVVRLWALDRWSTNRTPALTDLSTAHGVSS